MPSKLAQIRTTIEQGNKDLARDLIRQELKDYPSADAYYYAARIASNNEQREKFLQKALDIDPFHQKASQSLEKLKTSSQRVVNSKGNSSSSPSGMASSEMEVAMARQKSYVSAAIITFVGYIFFWLPGIIFNTMYLNDARRMQKVAGQGLPGVGCLWILLIINLGWLFFACSTISSIMGLGILVESQTKLDE